jgi:uncharacterized cupredoxin-like copper-binding protein
MRVRRSLLISAALAWAGAATGHEGADHARKAGAPKKEQKPWGIAGDAKAARRTVEVGMSDAMRFTPDRIDVRQGETVRFVVRNGGQVMHEFVIGTKAENDRHAELMMKFPTMEHDEPYMAHVAPGKTGEMGWQFTKAGEFYYGCLIPGHFEAGMLGKVIVK